MATQFYFRVGNALTEVDNGRVEVGAKGESGYLTREHDCPRCGGQGYIHGYGHVEGGICFKCRGRRTETRSHRVFTADRLETLNAAEARKLAKKTQAAAVKAEAACAEFATWRQSDKARNTLIGRITHAESNDFLSSLTMQIDSHKVLSDKQLRAAEESLDRMARRAEESAASEYVGAAKDRLTFRAEVLASILREGHYGMTDIIKLRDERGNLFTWFASDSQGLNRGDSIELRGTVKKHDEYRGTKQTILTRCKWERIGEAAAAA